MPRGPGGRTTGARTLAAHGARWTRASPAPHPISTPARSDASWCSYLDAKSGAPQDARPAVLERLKELLRTARTEAERQLDGRRQGAQVRPWSCDLPGRAHPPRLRLHRHLRLPRHQPVRCRAHGHRCHGRLRPRPAGALFRRRSPVPAALQADALGRERRGVHALPAVGPGAEGRTCHPHRRSVAQARPRRRDDPHLAARLAARCTATRSSSSS